MAQIDSRGDPGSPIQSKNDVGDAKNVPQKLLPVEGRHLGKWPLSTNSYSMAPPQPETIDKTRFRREKRLGKLLPVQGRHLGKWRISTDSASGGPRQSDSIEKSCRRPREGSHMLRA